MVSIIRVTSCMKGDSKLTVLFKIEGIESERHLDGKSTVKASAIYNGDKLLMQVIVQNDKLTDRQLIRDLLIDCFSEFTKSVKVKPISIGDFI